MPSLSVVLITKDQEWNVSRMIESVLAELHVVERSEVLLVDSASSDRTIAQALNYPVGVIRLHLDQRLTPAAGRYVGISQSSGDFVLFLDGDMQLCPGWLAKAMQFLNDHLEIGAIGGGIHDVPIVSDVDPSNIESPEHPRIRDITHIGGAALYRRSVLEEVGSFNPYVHSDEEPELCIRIRHAGYRVVFLDSPMVLHYSSPLEKISTLVGRRSRRLYMGAGQCEDRGNRQWHGQKPTSTVR